MTFFSFNSDSFNKRAVRFSKQKTLRPREIGWLVQGHKQSDHFWEATPVNQRSSALKQAAWCALPASLSPSGFRQNESVTCQACCEVDACKGFDDSLGSHNFRCCDSSSSLIRQYSSPSSLQKWIFKSIFFLKQQLALHLRYFTAYCVHHLFGILARRLIDHNFSYV